MSQDLFYFDQLPAELNVHIHKYVEDAFKLEEEHRLNHKKLFHEVLHDIERESKACEYMFLRFERNELLTIMHEVHKEIEDLWVNSHGCSDCNESSCPYYCDGCNGGGHGDYCEMCHACECDECVEANAEFSDDE